MQTFVWEVTKVNLHSKIFWRKTGRGHAYADGGDGSELWLNGCDSTPLCCPVGLILQVAARADSVLVQCVFMFYVCNLLLLLSSSSLHRSKELWWCAVAHAAKPRGVRCTCWPSSECRPWCTRRSPPRTSARTAGSSGGARPSPEASAQPGRKKTQNICLIKMLLIVNCRQIDLKKQRAQA